MRRDPGEILDELLVLRCQQGESAALDQLARRWNQRFLALAYRWVGETEAAREVVQEAWIAVVRGLGRLKDPARFKSWAFQIVHRKAVDRIRGLSRQRRLRAQLAAEPHEDEAPAPDPAAGAAIQGLRRAMAQLDPERRTMLAMFYAEEMTTRAIAEALAIPEGTVKTRLFHTRKRLKTLLEEIDEEARPGR
jgi:RNA polymerase sigma factor (sigma-70 family)